MQPSKPAFAFPFHSDIPEFVTDYDVAMAYEFFLGRTPESATVIGDHKKRRFDDLVIRFIHSDEFLDSTCRPLREGNPVRRLDHTKAPTRHQITWMIKNFVIDEADEARLYAAASWGEFFRTLLLLDGVPPEAPAPAVASPVQLVLAKLSQIEALIGEVRELLR